MIFGKVLIESTNADTSMIDALLANDEIKISNESESISVASARMLAESEYNWSQIMKTCAIDEMSTYVTEGEEAANKKSVKELFNGLIAWLKTLGPKIASLFKTAWSRCESLFKETGAFVKKNRAALDANIKEGFGTTRVDVYDFLAYHSKVLVPGSAAFASNFEDSLRKNISDIDGEDKKITEIFGNDAKTARMDKVCDKIVSGATYKNIHAELKAKLYGGDIKKDVSLGSIVKEYADWLETGAKAEVKTAVNEALKQSVTYADEAIKMLQKETKTFEETLAATEDEAQKKKANLKIEAAKFEIEIEKSTRQLQHSINSTALGAIAAAQSQAKAVVYKAIFFKKGKASAATAAAGNDDDLDTSIPGPEGKHESYQTESSQSLFKMLKLI